MVPSCVGKLSGKLNISRKFKYVFSGRTFYGIPSGRKITDFTPTLVRVLTLTFDMWSHTQCRLKREKKPSIQSELTNVAKVSTEGCCQTIAFPVHTHSAVVTETAAWRGVTAHLKALIPLQRPMPQT